MTLTTRQREGRARLPFQMPVRSMTLTTIIVGACAVR